MNADVVVVGLGNPGPRYAMTRHNVAFIALDLLARGANLSFRPAKKWKSEALDLEWNGRKALLLKPQTFMNLSGEAVQALYAEHNHLRDKPLIVLHDEVDLPFGRIRAKKGGGDAGHNGLKSLRECLGHGEFYRVRIGVSRPVQGSPIEVGDWVLQNFTTDEQKRLPEFLMDVLDVAELLLEEKLEEAQRVAAKAGN